jgi:DNA repair exonuclease SbcCD ATPase subunit
MERPRQHSYNGPDESASTELSEKIVPRPTVQDEGTAALELVHQAVELIRNLEDRATDAEARAQVIAQQTVDDLEFAKRRVHSAVAQREAALAALEEANVQVQEIEEALRRAESLLADNEVQLSTAELRANTAETRASEKENELMSVEAAIRVHLLDGRPGASRDLAAAA